MKLHYRAGAWWHYCPACNREHILPDTGGWKFNGNTVRPTFTPSFKQTMANNTVCHYAIENGYIQFCGDSWHKRTDKIEMPDISEE